MAEVEVRGLVVATQTCDIVRSPVTHPFVEVCPLVEVGESVVKEAQKLLRPAYLYIPSSANPCLVADLNRVMTVEKAVVAQWERMPGWTTDEELRKLQWSLARKRKRFAFPDDFNELIRSLEQRFKKKHDKQSPEGEFLRELPQVLVQAIPNWDAHSIELFSWFVRDENCDDPAGIVTQVDSWMEQLEPSGRFVNAEHVVSTFKDMTAQDYLSADMLDLEYLSTR